MRARRSPPNATLREARATTRRVARTFAVACRLLPATVRDDVYRLYLVFRTLDDAIDERRGDALERVVGVERWARGGAITSREAHLLAEVDGRHPLPRDALLDFCRGMRFDLERGSVETDADLDEYCYRVAGTVGVTMAAVLGTRAPAEREAAALGMAMQRTNILRDVEEDRAHGRVYLPRESLESVTSPDGAGYQSVVREQIARADALYDEGLAGVEKLACGRRAVRAAGVMYREILRQIEREGYGRDGGRAVVSRPRKLALVARHGVFSRA